MTRSGREAHKEESGKLNSHQGPHEISYQYDMETTRDNIEAVELQKKERKKTTNDITPNKTQENLNTVEPRFS